MKKESVLRKIASAVAREPKHLIIAGAVVRVFLILFSLIQDAYLKVKFTDIDYQVYTDAAYHVLRGGSAFDRETYRYTPLIAHLVVPNHVVSPSFGKLLFANADIIISILHLTLLRANKVRDRYVAPALALWLLNPYTATISSRGSSDSISSLCLMFMLLYLQRRRYVVAGFWFGLAVHIRVFPIIYGFPLMVHLGGSPSSIFTPKKGLKRLLALNLDKGLFSVSAAVTCLTLCLVFYLRDGQRYLDESIFYHFGRFDLAHNFSPWFFLFRCVGHLQTRKVLSLVAFLPQLVCCVYFGVVRKSSLPYALFMVTLSFVALNKVVTAQYFAWYLVLAPLIYSSLAITPSLKRAIYSWAFSQLNWLFWAYLYEFEHVESALVPVFISSVLFVVTNLYCMAQIDCSYSCQKV
jgi:phosphatidylinositol glycan class M